MTSIVSNVGIIGAGAMGRGIAQVCVAAGITVRLFDARGEAIDEAVAFVADMLTRAAAKGRMTEAEARDAAARLIPARAIAALADCQVVIEAVIEDLEIKRALFGALEDVVGEKAILATNTSSLSVADIAAHCRRPERAAGLHFFNPVPLMRVAEVVATVRTDAEVTETLCALIERIGHTALRAQDTPGFIVNHVGRGYVTESLRILGEEVADVADIDRIMREAAGFRMGPFELLDLTGLDVSHPVMERIYEQYYQEPRYRPSPIARQRLAAGLLGRKSGRGFYRYEDGKAAVPPEPAAPTRPLPGRVWLSRVDLCGFRTLRDALAPSGVEIIDAGPPPRDTLCLITPLGKDATTAILEQGLDPARTIAVDTLFGLSGRRTAMTNPAADPSMVESARAVLSFDKTPCTVVRDSIGFIAQRILAAIVNVACDMAQQGVAAAPDIDRGAVLGLGYPKGPLAWGDELGAGRVLAILEAMHRLTGDPRYRPSPWLGRRARLGLSLLSRGA